MNIPNFDNVVLSESTWAGMKEIMQPSNKPPSLFGGVNVVTSKFMPDKMAVLRQGEKVVAIVNIGEAQQSVHPTKATPRWFEVLVNKFRVLCSRLRG